MSQTFFPFFTWFQFYLRQCMWEVVAYAKNEWEHLKGELTEVIYYQITFQRFFQMSQIEICQKCLYSNFCVNRNKSKSSKKSISLKNIVRGYKISSTFDDISDSDIKATISLNKHLIK